MNRVRLLIILLLAAVLIGCGDDGPVKRSWGKMKGLDKVVGHMGDVLANYRSGWENWDRTGEYADWMFYE